ncbi:MAG: hypothetical protein CUN56_00395 [Phototrophicales bacterium]|nr:MAG: hypothetical protein CUN56_00395 [Phototrophicales bacterium]
MLARILGFLGLLILTAGVVMPVACPAESCELFTHALIDPERFETDTNIGIIQSVYGLLILATVIPTLFSIISGERGALLFSGLVSALIVGISFGDIWLRIENTSESLSWGWGLLGGGSLLLIFGALFAKRAPQVAAAASVGVQGAYPQAGVAGATPAMHKTMIEMPNMGGAGSIHKTAIDINYQQQGQFQGQAPYPPQPQAPYGQAPYPPQPQAPYGQAPYPPQPQAPYGQAPYPPQPAYPPQPPVAGFDEPIDPNLKTAIDLEAQVPPPQAPSYQQSPAAPPTAATPPTPPPQREVDMKTQIDAVQPAKPIEPDPYAWQKAMPTPQADEPPTEKEELPPSSSYEEPDTPLSPSQQQIRSYSEQLTAEQVTPPSPAAPPPPSDEELYKTNIAAEESEESGPSNLEGKTVIIPGGSTPPSVPIPPTPSSPAAPPPPEELLKTQIDTGATPPPSEESLKTQIDTPPAAEDDDADDAPPYDPYKTQLDI